VQSESRLAPKFSRLVVGHSLPLQEIHRNPFIILFENFFWTQCLNIKRKTRAEFSRNDTYPPVATYLPFGFGFGDTRQLAVTC